MNNTTLHENSSNSSNGGVILNPPIVKGNIEKSSNSSNSSKGQPSPRVEHFLTWFHYTEDDLKKFLDFCEFKCCKYAFQEEVCPTTGTLHIQGIIKLYRKERDTAFGLPKEIHWEKVRNEAQATRYCLKDHTHVGRRWTKGIPVPPRDPLAGLELRPWQAQVLSIIAGEPDDRKLYWYWDRTGNTGKTALTKHLCLKHGAAFVCGKPGDIFHSVAERVRATGAPRIIIFGYPRDKEDHIAYGAMEQVKDGIFFAGKYESGQIVMDNPHIFVFANFAPDESTMSKDRWVVVNIDPPQAKEMFPIFNKVD